MGKRFHISISTQDYAASVADYSARLGKQPDTAVDGRLAIWRTEELNFSISCKPGQKGGMVRHIGFEEDGVAVMREETDCNGLVWEYFTAAQQQDEVKTRVLAEKRTD